MVRTALVGGVVMAGILSLPAAAGKVEVQGIVAQEALRYGVPVSLALAVAQMESGFQADAHSAKGARGVMQIMPATASGEFGIHDANLLWNDRLNAQVGVAFLRQLHGTYGGRWDLALSHYNGGTVRGDRPHGYTEDYVAGVLAWQRRFAGNGCDALQPADIKLGTAGLYDCLEHDGGGIRQAALHIEPRSLSEAAEQAEAWSEAPAPEPAPRPEVTREPMLALPADPAPLPAPSAPVDTAPHAVAVTAPVVVQPYPPARQHYAPPRPVRRVLHAPPPRFGWRGRGGRWR